MEDTQTKPPVPPAGAPNAPAAETQQAASQQPAQPVPPSAAAQPAQVTQATSVPPTAPQAMAPAVKNSGKAIASLVCGIVGLIVFGPVLGTIALVMGVLARKETAPVGPYRGRGMATAGIVLGAVDIAFAVIALALGIAAFSFSTYY